MATPSAYYISKRLKKRLKVWKDNYDHEILDYCVRRTVIVCPRCHSLYEVKDLDEQLNTTWKCSVCHQRWEETPTHDYLK